MGVVEFRVGGGQVTKNEVIECRKGQGGQEGEGHKQGRSNTIQWPVWKLQACAVSHTLQ